ncbi:MAG: hypothetical protein M0T70_06750 [Geobacteraceae bacterium]|nr:hypothetical protein [Geobacteraceae bacterium]
MEAYITSVTLEINGEKLEDFNAFTEKERVFKKTVNLMNTTGTVKVKDRNHFSLDYVIPADKPEFDFKGVEDGTVTIDYENGKRISFGEVECLSIGEAKFDGDKEVTKTIEFVAGTRTEE